MNSIYLWRNRKFVIYIFFSFNSLVTWLISLWLWFIFHFFFRWNITELVRCVHRMQRIPYGAIVSVCWPMALNVVFWQPIVWYPVQVSKCVKMIKLLLMWKIIWKVWKWQSIGMVFINVAHNTMMVYHL